MATLEQKIRAKVPGADTGIEIRKTVCDICAPDHHCGVDAYVEDGRILKVEGSPDHPCAPRDCAAASMSTVRTALKRR